MPTDTRLRPGEPTLSRSDPLRPPVRLRSLLVAALPLLALVVTLVGFWWIEVSIPALVDGLDDTGRLLARMLPPVVAEPADLLSLLLETLLIAVAGTGLATLCSVPLAFVAAGTFEGARPLQAVVRAVIVLTRAIPTLVFAILFVRAFGLGPLAGALAVAVHSIGMIAKLMADAIEEVDPVPTEAVRACGASRMQVAVSSVLPRVMPAFVSTVLYRLDINVRASAILGIVGAGGIGVALQTALGSLNYRRAAGIIAVIIGLILLLELLSVLIRRRVSVHAGASSGVVLSEGRDPHTPGWGRGRLSRSAGVIGVIGLFAWSLSSLDADLQRLLDAWPRVQLILSGMWPPVFSAEIVTGVLESLLMAVSATVVGVVLGLVLAMLTAHNVTPLGPLSAVVRSVVVVLRGIPDLVYALLFVAALGLGPFPGFLALSISCTALAAKFFTDALEQLDPVPLEALRAVGATRWQVLVSGLFPQFVPSLTSNSLFVCDLALRESIVLGIVGAGGIGFLLQESIATLRYDVTSAILIVIAVVVFSIESLARWARSHVL
ncbi:phosphonate ABC transporter, permease protein PhnE [Blastococcus montanus]|uniref:phosphonate ABC transporter, permease protein PhnE n=1 Tax=Blastococcus montanus TaxID=3144973 RepID=UPI003208A8AB